MTDPNAEETIFATARELPEEERGAYLDRVCANNVPLREAVEELLKADHSAGTFLAEPASDMGGRMRFGAPGEPEVPETIGRYKLVERLGEGGCGVVYVADQEHPVRRRVALKVIKLGMDTKGLVARFEAERQALALMEHPNIAKILDAGATETGRPFFVMELVRGKKITTFCDEHRLRLNDRLELFVQVCRAVQHAHQKGVIHRDLKPSNVLVALHDGVPVPKVIDFGIAKATQGRLTDRTVYTAFEQFIGTPAYMSPEQAEMSGLDVDTRSDIYSLGVLLYELLTGETPFNAQELLKTGLDELRRAIREREPLRPSTKLKTMPGEPLVAAASTRQMEPLKLIHLIRGDLDWIVMKCLEKDRSRRYETANGLAMDVLRYLHDEPVLARPPSRLYQAQKLARKHRVILVSGVVAALALLLALVVLATSYSRIRTEKNEKDLALKERETALEGARASEHHAREQLFLALRNQAAARRHSGEMGQRFDSLAALSQAARIRLQEDVRDDVIATLALPDIQRGAKWRAMLPSTKAVAFDSNYNWYARLDEPGVVTIRASMDDRELQRLSAPAGGLPCGDNCALSVSPDGRFLALRDSELHLHLWGLAEGTLIRAEPSQPFWAMAFSNNSRRLVIGLAGALVAVDLKTGKEVSRWQIPSQAYTLAFSPDDQKLAVGYLRSSKVSVLKADDGTLLAELPVGNSLNEIVAWHPDSAHLATAGSDPGVQVWDVEAKRKLTTLEGNAQQVTLLSFHPGGELVASGGWEGVVRVWEPGSRRQVIKLPFGVQVGFSKNGRWLGVVWEDGEQAQLLAAVPSPEYHTFAPHSSTPEDVLYEGEISTQGNILAMGMTDGVHFFDLEARRAVGRLPIGTTLSVHFREEGSELITCGPESGLQRWRIERNETGTTVRLAHRTELPCTPMRAVTRNGIPLLAVVSEESEQALFVNLTNESVSAKTLPHESVSVAAMSPDGRFLATAGWHSSLVRLWDAKTSSLLHEWTLRGPMNVYFTPKSDELVICRDAAFDFVDVKTFAVRRTIPRYLEIYPGSISFTQDGMMMAMEISPAVVHLKEVSTGRTVARLEDPFGDRATWTSFTADGAGLVVAARYAGVLHFWDLRAIREKLKTMRLDWNWPEFQPAHGESGAGSATPAAFHFDISEQSAR